MPLWFKDFGLVCTPTPRTAERTTFMGVGHHLSRSGPQMAGTCQHGLHRRRWMVRSSGARIDLMAGLIPSWEVQPAHLWGTYSMVGVVHGSKRPPKCSGARSRAGRDPDG